MSLVVKELLGSMHYVMSESLLKIVVTVYTNKPAGALIAGESVGGFSK